MGGGCYTGSLESARGAAVLRVGFIVSYIVVVQRQNRTGVVIRLGRPSCSRVTRLNLPGDLFALPRVTDPRGLGNRDCGSGPR